MIHDWIVKRVQVIHTYKINVGYVIINSPKFADGLITQVLRYNSIRNLSGINFIRIKFRA